MTGVGRPRSTQRLSWHPKTGRAINHGTSGYRDGCRCDECFNAEMSSPGRKREMDLKRQARS